MSFSEEKSCHLAAIAVVYGWKILDEKRKMVLVQKDVGTMCKMKQNSIPVF